jgi:hypothetical protein
MRAFFKDDLVVAKSHTKAAHAMVTNLNGV